MKFFPGDGLVFDSSNWRSPDEPEEGGNVFEVDLVDETHVALAFGHRAMDARRIRVGDLVWRTNDPKLRKKTRWLLNQPARNTIGLTFHVVAQIGQPISIRAVSDRGESAEFVGEVLALAESRGLDNEILEKQLGRLGNTPFHLGIVKTEMDDSVFCPVSILNQARRKLVEHLINQRQQIRKSISKVSDESKRNLNGLLSPTINANSKPPINVKPSLHLLVRNQEQLDASIECCPASITLDYLELYGLRPSIEKIQSAGIVARVASPRILKPNEQKVVRFLLSLQCQILVRSGGLLHDLVNNFKDYEKLVDAQLPEIHGDFSLNAANSLTFGEYCAMGLQRIAPSHDLNAKTDRKTCFLDSNRLPRSYCVSPSSRFSYRALCVLSFPVRWNGQHQLRSSLRKNTQLPFEILTGVNILFWRMSVAEIRFLVPKHKRQPNFWISGARMEFIISV